MTLPLLTPEEMAFRLGIRSDMPFAPTHVIEATIRADREAIAKAVAKILSNELPGPDEYYSGWSDALEGVIALLRPQNKKGEPPLDDSPTAPLV